MVAILKRIFLGSGTHVLIELTMLLENLLFLVHLSLISAAVNMEMTLSILLTSRNRLFVEFSMN